LTSFALSDHRLDHLRELYKDHRDFTDTLQAVGGGTRVSLLDTKGILAGSNGIRRCFAPVNVLLHVLRGFSDKDITHFDETIDPLRDYRTVNKEMKAQVLKINILISV
jgi:ribosome-binding ATPase YchF (GTP1/OBG family)